MIDGAKQKPKIVTDFRTAVRYLPFALETIEMPKNISTLSEESAIIYLAGNMDETLESPLSPMSGGTEESEESRTEKDVVILLGENTGRKEKTQRNC